MTDEQINLAIAQHLGWRAIAFSYGIGVIGIPPARNECDPVYPKSVMWTADLNAMHEAEKMLMRADLLFEYGMHISIDHKYDYLLRATARQRAEAFLRTLGKWEEVQK